MYVFCQSWLVLSKVSGLPSLSFLIIQVVQGMGFLLRSWPLLKPDIHWSLPKFFTTVDPDHLVDMEDCRSKAL